MVLKWLFFLKKSQKSPLSSDPPSPYVMRVNITPVYSARYLNETLFKHKITPLSRSPTFVKKILVVHLLYTHFSLQLSEALMRLLQLLFCCQKTRDMEDSSQVGLLPVMVGFWVWIKVRARITPQRCVQFFWQSFILLLGSSAYLKNSVAKQSINILNLI